MKQSLEGNELPLLSLPSNKLLHRISPQTHVTTRIRYYYVSGPVRSGPVRSGTSIIVDLTSLPNERCENSFHGWSSILYRSWPDTAPPIRSWPYRGRCVVDNWQGPIISACAWCRQPGEFSARLTDRFERPEAVDDSRCSDVRQKAPFRHWINKIGLYTRDIEPT